MRDVLGSPFGCGLLAAGLVLAVLAIWVGRRRPRSDDAFAILGTTAKAAKGTATKVAKARTDPVPVDLAQPIRSDADWARIRNHAADARYQKAVATVRARYRIVGNPMLLPNTLRETMSRAGLTFREAMIRVSEDDGLHGHR